MNILYAQNAKKKDLSIQQRLPIISFHLKFARIPGTTPIGTVSAGCITISKQLRIKYSLSNTDKHMIKIKIPRFLINLKIDYERWLFRHRSDAHIPNQMKAIAKANRLSKKYHKRLWVITLEPGRYLIRSKPEMKTIMRQIPDVAKINMYQINDYIVHITQKTNENN